MSDPIKNTRATMPAGIQVIQTKNPVEVKKQNQVKIMNMPVDARKESLQGLSIQVGIVANIAKGVGTAVVVVAACTPIGRGVLMGGALLAGVTGCFSNTTKTEERPTDLDENIAITVDSAPVSEWKKGIVQAEVMGNGFRLSAIGGKPLVDCDQFSISPKKVVAYGQKQLSITIEVDSSFKQIDMGSKIFQLMLNGVELKPIGFSLDIGSDGKGFIPAKSGTYVFEVPKDTTLIGNISFMTALGENYGVTVKDIRINVKAETDPRRAVQSLQVSKAFYQANQPKLAVVGLPKDSAVSSVDFTVADEKGTIVYSGTSRFNKMLAASGEKVMALDWSSVTTPGKYVIAVPKQPGINVALMASLVVSSSTSQMESTRNAAWLAFNWFTDGDAGPYRGAHPQDKSAAVYGSDKKKDVYGGWNDAGDYGKYVVNGAYSAGLMMLTEQNLVSSKLEVGAVSHDDSGRSDILSIAKHELDWMLKMQEIDGSVHHKVATADFPALTVSPEQDIQAKTIMPISTTATADFAAALALGANRFKASGTIKDQQQADVYLAAAEKAWAFLEQHSTLIMTAATYDGKAYGGAYTDNKDTDERLWAAVELFKATGKEMYHAYIKNHMSNVVKLSRFGDKAPDWSDVNHLAVFSYAMAPSADPALVQQVKAALIKYGDDLLTKQKENPYGIAIAGQLDKFDWGSNGVVANMGLQLVAISKLTGDTKYANGAFVMYHYLEGMNPNGKNYTTGASDTSAKSPHFRPSASGAYPVPAGMMVGGPNNVEYGGDQLALALSDKPPMKIYVDSKDSWATNEVAINWQSTWGSFTAALVDYFKK